MDPSANDSSNQSGLDHVRRLLQRQLESQSGDGRQGIRPSNTNTVNFPTQLFRDEVNNDDTRMATQILRPSLAARRVRRALARRAPPDPIRRRRVERDPAASRDARERTMEIMNASIQELSQICTRMLRHEQPLVQSRIQSLLAQQERLDQREQELQEMKEEEVLEEEESASCSLEDIEDIQEKKELVELDLSVAFLEVEQITADMEVLRPVYSARDHDLTREELRTLFRVLEGVYFDMRDTIGEMEDGQDGEEIEEGEVVIGGGIGTSSLAALLLGGLVGGNNNEAEGGNAINAGINAGIGMATALLGVASGMVPNAGQGASGLSPEIMQRMVRDFGLPADFFANVAVPMQEETLQAMPSTTYQNQKGQIEREINKECNICLQPFDDEDMVRLFPCCQCVQHTDCLTEWFNRKDTCVVCKKKVCETLEEKKNEESNSE